MISLILAVIKQSIMRKKKPEITLDINSIFAFINYDVKFNENKR
jgi:hypothetical protein